MILYEPMRFFFCLSHSLTKDYKAYSAYLELCTLFYFDYILVLYFYPIVQDLDVYWTFKTASLLPFLLRRRKHKGKKKSQNVAASPKRQIEYNLPLCSIECIMLSHSLKASPIWSAHLESLHLLLEVPGHGRVLLDGGTCRGSGGQARPPHALQQELTLVVVVGL